MDDSSYPLTLSVLGQPSLRDVNGVVPPALGWGKPLALLAVLAIRGQVRRDEAVDLLWRDVDEAKARNAFRQALHRLRSAVGDELLPQDREVLRLVPSDALDIDLHRFEAAVTALRLDDAIRLYRGDFLDGVALDEPAFDQWAEQERSRLRAQFRRVLEDAVSKAQGAGNWTDAMAFARRLLDVAPFEETAARVAATALLSAGRRAEAQDVLAQFAARLQAELGLPMPSELQALLRRLERQAEGGSASAQPAPLPGPAPSLLLRFVGREPELTQLLSLWRATGEDAGTLALIEGGDGIGKTRLLTELAIHARSLRPSTVLQGRERAGAAPVPFAMFAEALKPLVRAAGIVGASRHLLAEAARLLPELRDSLDLPPASDVEDEAARVRFFEGVAALVDAAAYERPLLIVLDDLHDAGPSSLDMLSYLAARLRGSAVMFALSAQPARAPASVLGRLRSLASLGSDGAEPASRSTLISLSPLSRDAAAAAIEDAAQRLRIPQLVVERILDRAGGLPALLPELLRRAESGDDIAQVPVSIRSLLQNRIQSLSSGQRRTFLVLALFGRPVSMSILAAAAHLSPQAAAETAGALLREELAERSEAGEIQPNPTAAELGLEIAGQASRAFLAGWIAEALADNRSTHPAELARFFSMAGRTREAYEWSRRAALAAMVVGAWSEAIPLLKTARSFATNAAEIADVEGMLAALGAGHRRIAAAAPATAPVGEPHVGQAAGETATSAAEETLWVRWFPNWRMLLGGAVATLLVSTFVLWRSPAQAVASSLSGDTLMVLEGPAARTVRFVTGSLLGGFSLSPPAGRFTRSPAWADSLARPWANALPDPRGESVALSRIGPGGAAAFVISADRSDTVLLASADGDARPLGWSPDGRWVLVTITAGDADGTPDADLFSIRADGSRRIPIDTTSHRSVVEAAWSPDGSRIAWVARVGGERQQDVFVSLADGSGADNVTRHPADDYHISWSGDGELLGFTSLRDGNAELYAVSMRETRLWRLTRDAAQDDWGRFSASGRLIAFESTRGGSADVYIMAALGGEPVRIGAVLPLTIADWRGRGRYVERARLEVSGPLAPGDTAELRVTTLDQFGEPIVSSAPDVRVLDSLLLTLARQDTSANTWRALGLRAGMVRVVAEIVGWRSDTAVLRVGNQAVALMAGAPAPREWRPLGQPRPGFSDDGVALNGDREWESGILSRGTYPLLGGLSLSVRFDALPQAVAPAAGVSVALVAVEGAATLDTLAPQFLRYASFSLDADARRFVYSVGREVFAEAAMPDSRQGHTEVELAIQEDSTVAFSVGGVRRWRSTIKVIAPGSDSRAQVWIGGRATGSAFRIRDVRAGLDAR